MSQNTPSFFLKRFSGFLHFIFALIALTGVGFMYLNSNYGRGLDWIEDETLWIEVIDHGRGIADVAQAMEPLYTTRQECDRAGMGFTFMDAFMDTLEVTSAPEKGTTVRMSRHITRKNVDGPFDYRDHKLPVAICR